MSRQYEKSISVLRHSLDLNSNSANTHIWLGMDYTMTGELFRCPSRIPRGKSIITRPPISEGLWGYAEARSGKIELARERLRELTERSRRNMLLH